jgi:hypothetical protein
LQQAEPKPSNWLSKPLPMEGRFGLLPIKEEVPGMGPSLFNKRSAALPGLLAGAVNAFTAPGRALRGGMAEPEKEGVEFGLNVMGGGLLGSRMAPAPRGSLGMNAYHGSRHAFDAFDLNKVGAGEGAQAYGHGLYFAENPGVAKSYITAGAGTKANLDGKRIEALTSNQTGRPAQRGSAEEVADWIDSYSDRNAVRERMRTRPDLLKVHDELEKAGRLKYTEGNLYHVDIPDEAIGKMLDWDKPLSQQPANVRQALEQIGPTIRQHVSADGLDMGGGGKILNNSNRQAAPDKPYPWVLKTGNAVFGLSQKDVDRMIGSEFADLTGNQAYTRLTAALGSQVKASEALRAAGIPGMRYLDGGSRAGGNGTRNFVLFDDKLAKITKRE